MTDLDEFLRQAAQRRKNRQDNQASARAAAPPPAKPPVRTAERAAMVEIIEPEILEPSAPPAQTEGASLDASIPLRSRELGADMVQRLQAHVQQTFDHGVGNLKQTHHPVGQLNAAASVTTQETQVQKTALSETEASVISWLRDHKHLKAAFVVSEIFRRPDY
jgi:hypothetical protein